MNPLRALSLVAGLLAAACSSPAPAEWRPETASFLFTTYRDGNAEVVVGSGDSIVARLTRDGAFDGFARWSPDGARVAFDSDRAGAGNRDLYVMDADGSHVVRLTDDPGFDFAAAWSPDGAWIAFVSTRDSDFLPERRNFEAFRGEIYRVRPDGRDLQRLTFDARHDQTPAWLPDGSAIGFCRDEGDGNGSLWTVAVDGTGETPLVEGPGFACSPVWSPAGDHVAWRLSRGDSALLVVAAADGSAPTVLPTGLRYAYEPDWSPDGAWLCFTGGPSEDSLDIHAIRIADAHAIRLTTHPARDQACDWTPE